MFNKVCPLMVNRDCLEYDVNPVKFCKQYCAWWKHDGVDKEGMCAITAIARSLDFMLGVFKARMEKLINEVNGDVQKN